MMMMMIATRSWSSKITNVRDRRLPVWSGGSNGGCQCYTYYYKLLGYGVWGNTKKEKEKCPDSFFRSFFVLCSRRSL